MNVPIRELKANLSRYLRQVQDGEELTITKHGKPVGKIVPITDPEPRTEAEILEGLRSLRWVRPGDPGAFVGSPCPLPYHEGMKTVAELVGEDRGGRE